ncbi:MAG TPA: precorrin-4 C(11)-methyltransferase [Pirellulales bacterium]|jgi:precorrin-4 C11-methyltransferase|nr:precorrin-4 C(11)-methyltransferase [Pirellulales bacterium]
MTRPRKIVLVAVTEQGVEHARRLRSRLRAGELHRPARYGPPQEPWDKPFEGPLSQWVREWFAGAEQLVFFLAAGAVVRLLAPLLGSKATDPGVLVIDEAGRFVIPLLSGHEGRANTFARDVAAHLGAIPVVTTASEATGEFSLAELEESFGWVAKPAERFKPTAMAIVNRRRVAVVQEIGYRGCWLSERSLPDNVTVAAGVDAFAGSPEAVIWITDRTIENFSPDNEQRILWYRPKSLVLGVGCERGVSLDALEDGLRRVLSEQGFALASISTLASADVKADEAAIVALAERHGWQTVFFTPEELAQTPGIANPSVVVQACVGTPGVAEPAALLAARTDRLLIEKQIVTSDLSPRKMTFALARSQRFQSRSEAAGKVIFMGAGPGDPDLLTLKAARLLGQADVVIYAGSLIPAEMLRHAPPAAAVYNSAALTLEEIHELTLTAARAGQRVVRLQSGDTSLYSTIQEQMTLLDDAGIEFEVIPGISSFQAAAAALNSELTLPEVAQTVILTRAEGKTKMPEREDLAGLAAHRATLCIFLSALLAEETQEQLLTAYPADTPVAILYRVSWPDEKILTTTLANLAAEVRRHRLTRTTLILVGEAVGGRKNRSRLYDKTHGHIFRASDCAANPPA